MRRRILLPLALGGVASMSACALFETEDPTDCVQPQGVPTSLRSLDMDVEATLNLGFAPSLPAVADFDGDGNIDIAVADVDGGGVAIWGGQGGWNFSMLRELPGDGAARAVGAADFDGDGTLDLAIAGTGIPNGDALDDHLRIIYGGDDFASADPVTYPTEAGFGSALGTTSIAIGDMDGDMDLEVITGTEEGGGFIFFNEGGQAFRLGERYEGSGHASQTILVDLKGDGNLSMITYGLASKLADDPSLEGQTVSDAFIRAYSMFEGELREEPGDTPGTQAPHPMPIGSPGVTVIDFNGDNQPEPIGSFNAALHVYGNVAGRISSDTAHLICMENAGVKTELSGLVATELDQDMTPEIVTYAVETGELAVLAVRASVLTAPVFVDAKIPGGEHLASEDVDGDGWPEILVTDPEGNALHIVAVQ